MQCCAYQESNAHPKHFDSSVSEILMPTASLCFVIAILIQRCYANSTVFNESKPTHEVSTEFYLAFIPITRHCINFRIIQLQKNAHTAYLTTEQAIFIAILSSQ